MGASFFFYDLETSGFSPREARIMQFAGQRTDLNLKPIGEPVNVLITMTEDVLPDPEAILITGITPQQTVSEGLSEIEFLKLFNDEVAVPDTIFVGYNTVRFDDEFMRFLLYRNFYDAYEWQWQDRRSRWDLLDLVRMTRALRPEGIKWPVDAKGQPTNRLELLTAINKLDHANAHDALNDVQATIALAKLIKTRQPKLFDFLLKLRGKKELAAFTSTSQPFIYTSGKYPSQYEKTTVVVKVADHPTRGGILVYDLRHDPTPFETMTPNELAAAMTFRRDEGAKDSVRLPVKTLLFNRCPAVAPLSVLDKASQERLELDMDSVKTNQEKLSSMVDFPKRLLEAQAILDKQQESRFVGVESIADAQLYDGFVGDQDKNEMRVVRSAKASELRELTPKFSDKRLQKLWPLYKARNFPTSLSDEETETWEQFKLKKLMNGGDSSRFAKFMVRIADIAAAGNLTAHQEYLLEELRLWGESILPASSDE